MLTAGLMRETLPVKRLVGIGVDLQFDRLAGLDPRRHLLRDLGGHLQRIEPDDRHHRHLRLDQLAQGDQPLLDVAVERRADAGVAQFAVGELHRRFRGLDAGAQVLGVLQRRRVAGLLRLSAALASSSVCCEMSVRLKSSLARSKACVAWTSSAFAFCTSGVFSMSGRCWDPVAPYARACGRARPSAARRCTAVFRGRAPPDLTGRHPVAEVGQNPADLSVSLGRNRDLVDGGQRADDVDRTTRGLLPNQFDLNFDRRSCHRCWRGPRSGSGTAGCSQQKQGVSDDRGKTGFRPGARPRSQSRVVQCSHRQKGGRYLIAETIQARAQA